MSRRTPAVVGLVLSLALVLSGCLSMPTGGPVVADQTEGGVNGAPGFSFDPKPPQPGDTRADIVRGFLVAMTATPIQTNTAKEFLTSDAAAAWSPEDKTITYVDSPPPPLRETASGVAIELAEPHYLDAQGVWQGTLPKAQRTIDFPMSFEDGEWRIDAAPDALIVPETWFEQRFQTASLYFFDPTASILVPEPVYAPSGRQLASSLIQALLLGPGPGLNRVSQSFIPEGMALQLSVSVSADGIADIALRGDPGQLTPPSIELMLVQMAWTLRQVREITALRVSVNGSPVALPNGVSSYRIDGGAEYDPAGYQSTPLLYALREGRLSSGSSAGGIEPVSGPLGASAIGIRSVGVSLSAESVAGVTDDGRSVLVAPVSGSENDPIRTVYSGGTDLLRPGWDFADRMWLVDRTGDGAVVNWVSGKRTETVDIPGITGRRVSSFVVSRDGTRLVAVVRREGRTAIVVSRIAHNRSGRVLWATPASTVLSPGTADLPVRSIAWRSPTVLGVLSPFAPSVIQVRSAAVDGSPGGESTTVEGRLRELVGSPAAADSLYGVTSSTLVDLSGSVPRVSTLPEDVTGITYAG